jgi:hypothetical protein
MAKRRDKTTLYVLGGLVALGFGTAIFLATKNAAAAPAPTPTPPSPTPAPDKGPSGTTTPLLIPDPIELGKEIGKYLKLTTPKT